MLMNPPDLILASQSPRRKDLLACLGWTFEVAPAAVNEAVRPGESPGDYVVRLATAKARAVAERASPAAVVLGADTAVVDQGDILGKPADASEAILMLRRLRGRTHRVYSAVTVLWNGACRTDLCETEVPMRPYSEEEIQVYAASGDPLDKAGAYAIQNPSFHPAPDLQGCFANVMGFPLCHLTRTLHKFDLSPPSDVPGRCQELLGYDCPVYEAILQSTP